MAALEISLRATGRSPDQMNFEERLVGRSVRLGRTDIRLATEELTNQVSQRRVQLGLLSVATKRTRRE